MTEENGPQPKTGEALRDSESLLAFAQEMAHLGSWEIDYDSDTIIWSDETYRIVGLTRSEFDGKRATYFNIIHPDDREWVTQQAKNLQKGERFEQTYRIIRPDGEERSVHVQGMVTIIEDDVPRRARGFIQDITERKTSEDALRESEKHLNEAQRIAHIGSWEFSERSKILTWSDEVYRIFGVTKEAFLPTPDNILATVHPDDRARVIKEREEGQREENYSFSYRIARPDGEIRFVRQISLTLARQGSELIHRSGTLQDITEHVAAEAALRASEANLNQAQRIAHIGSWETNEHTKTLTWSDEVYRIFGQRKETFEPTVDGFMEAVHPDDHAIIWKAIEKEAQGIQDYTYVHRIVRPDGEVRTVRQVAQVNAIENGAVIRRGTVQDITEQASTEEDLRQAQKMEAIGQLTGGVAHDFNNLLTVILGNLELIRDGVNADDAVSAMIDRSVKATEQGAALTARLLAFSRKQNLMPTTIDLNKLVAGIMDMLRRTLGERVEITSSEAENLWLCSADQSQLENALLNLAINARDAMAEGGRLTIETANISLRDDFAAAQAEVEPGDYIALSVSDTGSGIASDTLKHVFEPFFTTKSAGVGSGLGLSMVYGFAKQSDGNVTIYSELGKGTTVKLYLPRSAGVTDETDTSRAESVLPSAQGETILIVEDDVDVRTLAVVLLSGLGYEIVEAGDAEAALAVLQHSARIDLLLSDVVLAGAMNGPDLALEIRRGDPTIKIVFMTGYAKEAFDNYAGLDERTLVIQKPFNKITLANIVRRGLDEGNTRS